MKYISHPKHLKIILRLKIFEHSLQMDPVMQSQVEAAKTLKMTKKVH